MSDTVKKSWIRPVIKRCYPITYQTESIFWDVILLLLIGSIFGWFVRTHTLNDRYILALALKYETAAKYYNERTDQLISANQPKTKGATTP